MPSRPIVLAGLAVVVSIGATDYSRTEHRAASPIDGVWEYVNPGMRGQSYLIEGRYVFFSYQTGAAANDTARRVFAVDAGTFTVSDSLVTSRREYASDPRQIGQTWRWSYTMKGDTAIYHVLNDAGQAMATGRAVRMRSAH